MGYKIDERYATEVHVSLSFQTCSAYIRLASVKMFVPRKEFHKIIRKISQNQEEILFSKIRVVNLTKSRRDLILTDLS